MQRLRSQWAEEAKDVPAKKLVIVDESGANAAMTRARGRAPRGERVAGPVPNGHWSTLTIGALRLEGLAAAATVDAATDGPIFRSFVTDALVPALRRGDVVVWDGLAPHKAASVEAEAVEAAGASLLPLPPYSPAFSPIEPMRSKVKQDLRGAEARTPTALGEAAAGAFASLTAAECRGGGGN